MRFLQKKKNKLGGYKAGRPESYETWNLKVWLANLVCIGSSFKASQPASLLAL
jgi:hypothetical protein